jgi:hypothetical protein
MAGNRVASIMKFDEVRRWFTCVVMVADDIDAHSDAFTVECVERAADEFITHLAEKALGLMHRDFKREITYIGHWFTCDGGVFDGLVVPPNSWVGRMKVHDDEVWAAIIDGHLTGMSIAGRFEHE